MRPVVSVQYGDTVDNLVHRTMSVLRLVNNGRHFSEIGLDTLRKICFDTIKVKNKYKTTQIDMMQVLKDEFYSFGLNDKKILLGLSTEHLHFIERFPEWIQNKIFDELRYKFEEFQEQTSLNNFIDIVKHFCYWSDGEYHALSDEAMELVVHRYLRHHIIRGSSGTLSDMRDYLVNKINDFVLSTEDVIIFMHDTEICERVLSSWGLEDYANIVCNNQDMVDYILRSVEGNLHNNTNNSQYEIPVATAQAIPHNNYEHIPFAEVIGEPIQIVNSNANESASSRMNINRNIGSNTTTTHTNANTNINSANNARIPTSNSNASDTVRQNVSTSNNHAESKTTTTPSTNVGVSLNDINNVQLKHTTFNRVAEERNYVANNSEEKPGSKFGVTLKKTTFTPNTQTKIIPPVVNNNSEEKPASKVAETLKKTTFTPNTQTKITPLTININAEEKPGNKFGVTLKKTTFTPNTQTKIIPPVANNNTEEKTSVKLVVTDKVSPLTKVPTLPKNNKTTEFKDKPITESEQKLADVLNIFEKENIKIGDMHVIRTFMANSGSNLLSNQIFEDAIRNKEEVHVGDDNWHKICIEYHNCVSKLIGEHFTDDHQG